MRRRRHDPRRRRDHRRIGFDRRKRNHGRKRTGDPRSGRRQKFGDGRYEGAVGPYPRQSHRTARRELPRQNDRTGRRRFAPENPERNRTDDPAGRIHAGIRNRLRHAQTVRGLRGSEPDDRRTDLAVRLPDPDNDRGTALGHRHRRYGPCAAGQRNYQIGPRRRNRRRRRHAAAGQNRYDHHRQPQGHPVPSDSRHGPGAADPDLHALFGFGRDTRRQIYPRTGPLAECDDQRHGKPVLV